MIHYQLRCSHGHGFDGWFKDSGAFEQQAKAALIACPDCADTAVERALMSPAIGKRRKGRATEGEAAAAGGAVAAASVPAVAPGAANAAVSKIDLAKAGTDVATAGMPDQIRAVLQRLRAEVETQCENVGPRFAEEARAIHRGDAEARGIYGESTPEQAEALADEGIEIARIPWVPRADG